MKIQFEIWTPSVDFLFKNLCPRLFFFFFCWEVNSVFLFIFTASSQRRTKPSTWYARDEDIYWTTFYWWEGSLHYRIVSVRRAPWWRRSNPLREAPRGRESLAAGTDLTSTFCFQNTCGWVAKSDRRVFFSTGRAESCRLREGRRKQKVLLQLIDWSYIFHPRFF